MIAKLKRREFITLLGGDEQFVGHSEAKHSGGLDIDDQFELG